MSGTLGQALAARLMQGNFTGSAALHDRPIPQPSGWAAPAVAGTGSVPAGAGFFGTATLPTVIKPPAPAAPAIDPNLLAAQQYAASSSGDRG